MDYSRRSLTIQAILAFAMVMAVAWGTRYNWPDYVHVKYGLPATWGVHTLVTIAGPADSWRVNLQTRSAPGGRRSTGLSPLRRS